MNKIKTPEKRINYLVYKTGAMFSYNDDKVLPIVLRCRQRGEGESKTERKMDEQRERNQEKETRKVRDR